MLRDQARLTQTVLVDTAQSIIAGRVLTEKP
jgi:hypothetical protein